MPEVKVLEHDAEAAYAKFELGGLPDELTSPLVFDFRVHEQVNVVDGPESTRLLLDNSVLDIAWERQGAVSNQGGSVFNTTTGVLTPAPSPLAIHVESRHSFDIQDTFGFTRQVDFSLTGSTSLLHSSLSEDNAEQILNFAIRSIDGLRVPGRIGFAVVVRLNPYLNLLPPYRPTLESVISLGQAYSDPFMPPSSFDIDDHSSDDDVLDIESEIFSLLLLEDQAGVLQAEIAAKRQRIAGRLRDHRDQVSLKHLLQQCDGVMCAAKVIAQRICDKVGIATEPSFKYLKLQDSRNQQVISFGDEKGEASKNQTRIHVSEKGGNGTHQASLPVYLSKDNTSSALPNVVDFTTPAGTLFHILEIIAGALGLIAIFSWIRRKCMSPRSRAERLADREERRNARAYRRAARRALVRQRWSAFLSALNCRKSQNALPERRIEDYEEKRALILQDAFFEQELEHAEKGEVMEAEIRELRNAHDIVRSLVQNGEGLPMYMRHDPPPAMVPLPECFTPVTRSRASTGTLPSYTSESLPDYTSTPDLVHYPLLTDASSSGLGSSDTGSDAMDPIFSPVTRSEAGFRSSTGSVVGSDGERHWPTRSTPTSSVIETSPRPSDETLRTITTGGRRSQDCSD